ncbi:MAG: hypothetical protein JXB85_08990 [Anaerolineales bacterium]|nr:hypothetical protein [Anaerolineales bacterium]
MENYITCPSCKKTIANHELIEAAAKKENLGSSFLVCDCGERITFWAITAQLRGQKTLGAKIKDWLSGASKKRTQDQK